MLFNFTFQEASPLIVYSAGQWTEGSPSNDTLTANYDGSFRVTQINGATATLNFLASGISLFGALRDNHGNYTVNLDQNPQFTASGFSAVNTFKQPLFQAPNLAYTYHQATITNLVEPTGPYFDLDFVTIERRIGLPKDQAFQETLDDSSSLSITYSPEGSWSPISSSSAMRNTLHQTTVAQAQVTVQFQGCCIELYGHYANARYTVTLDQRAPLTFQGPDVDLTSQQQHPQTLLYLMDGLSEDNHNITLTNSDSNAARPFYFDYAVAWTTKSFTGGSGNTTGTGGSGSTSATNSNTVTPIAPIVGGVVGGLLVLAIVMAAFFIRRRRHRPADGSQKPEIDAEYTPVPFIAATHGPLPNVAEGLTQSARSNSSMIPAASYHFSEKGRMRAVDTSSSENRDTSDLRSSTANVESAATVMTWHAHTHSSSNTGLSEEAGSPSVPAMAGIVLENSSRPAAVTLPPAYNQTWHQEDRRNQANN